MVKDIFGYMGVVSGGGGGSSDVTKTYVDTQDKALNSKIEQTETETKAYADTQDNILKTEIEAYADTQDTALEAEVKSYADAQDTALKADVKSYADTQDTALKNEVKSYADTQDKALEEELKTYANSQDTILSENINLKLADYAKTEDLTGYAKTEDLATVATSGSYADLKNKPTSLPANGGNADTVDGKHASDFAKANLPTSIPVPLNISEASSKWYRLFCFNPIAGGVVNFSLAGGHPFNAGGSFVVTASWDKFNVKAISFSSNFESLRVKAVRCGYSIAGDNLHYIDVKLEVAEALVSSSVLFLTIGNDSNVSNKNIDLSGLGSDVDSVTYTSNYVKTITNNTEDVAVVLDSWEGYAKLSNGLYMEWGNEYLGNEGSLIDISFHNAFVAVPVVMISTDSVSNSFPCVSMSSKTGFKMQKTVEPTIAFWLAVGKL